MSTLALKQNFICDIQNLFLAGAGIL